MSVRRVRIYNGENRESNIIGFSASASDAPYDLRFIRFMEQRGYILSLLTEWPVGVTVEVRPPLSEEHTRELGILCVGGTLDGNKIIGIIDPYNDEVQVLDNRIVSPEQAHGLGQLIARC